MRFIEEWFTFIFIFALVFGLLGLGCWMDSAACQAKWEESGFPSRWGLLSGCQIQTDGKWMPADVYRELED